MEFSSDVLTGLGYLANGSHFTDDNFKRIINSSLGLLAGDRNIDRISTICPEKADIVRKSYTALLTFTLEVLRFLADEEIKNLLTKQSLKSDRIDYYLKIFNLHKDSIVLGLKNCGTSWPNLIDANWRLDFVVKTNAQHHIAEPIYFIILSTAREGKIEYIKFTCNLHQLQDLCTKLKEILTDMTFVTGVSEPWNISCNYAPPTCSMKTTVKRPETQELMTTVSSAVRTLKSMEVLKFEGKVLAAFLYRFKRLFRQDKGVQLLAQLKQALNRYYTYDVTADMEKLKGCFPNKIPPNSKEAYLPTQQMLKWVLLRLMANAKIFVRIIELCLDASKYIFARINTGWSAPYMMLALAISSRIWVCSKYVLMKITEWYDKLQIRLPLLTDTVQFLKGFEFPKTMKDFIGFIDLSPPSSRPDIDKIFEMIDLTRYDECGDDDVVLVNESIRTVNVDNDEDVIEEHRMNKKRKQKSSEFEYDDDDDMVVLYEKTKKRKQSTPNLAHFSEDLGEPVQRKKK